MSDLGEGTVTLHCATNIDGRKASSTIAVPRGDWDELPEGLRDWERARVRALHADHLWAEQGVFVDPNSLVVTVSGAGSVGPGEETT